MDTHKHQQEFAKRIDEKLAGISFPREPGLLYEPVRYTLAIGGKRIRPYLALCGCGISGGDPGQIWPAALAVELLHNFTLLHDDIMDAADTRRGRPSVYKKWDTSTAILAGDVLFAWAFDQLNDYGKSEKYDKMQYARIMRIFVKSARIVCEGQALDLNFENRRTVSLEEYLDMIRGKTAALISGSLELGGAVGGASEVQMKYLEKAGLSIGLAFQIQDDLLDAIADSEKFGKRRGGDIREGKKTFLSILALERAGDRQRSDLLDVFSTQKVDDKDIDHVISLYNELDILTAARERIDHFYGMAVDTIDEFRDNEYKGHLKKLLNNLLNREY